MAKALDSFSITLSQDGYLLQFGDEDDETYEFLANFEQLDLIAEEIERILDTHEEEELTAEPGEEPSKD